MSAGGSEVGVTASSVAKPNFDAIGKWWAIWCIIWTFFVSSGAAFLISRRQSPVLRLRGLGLSLAAIGLLHLYWISVQIGYIVGPLAPGNAEFWIMGLYLPFGIALFHASNLRFLHVAKAQKKYARPDISDHDAAPSRPVHKGLIARFRSLDFTTKTLAIVGAGMVLQLFLTILMYVISRKYHSSWGIPGTEVTGTEMEQKMEMGKGWEWWPSVVWQFFWAWLVAPITLWQSRGIKDTSGWRTQTIGCAIANLHATPMWLIALYVPAMAPVDAVFIPPQWICLSIMLMEIFTVFLPCVEVLRHQTLRQETLDSIAQWESKNKFSSSKSMNTGSTMIDTINTGLKSHNGSVKTNGSGESILTMSALEYVLERNPQPLQDFSALRDFSGENIAFLTNVGEWKSSLPPAVRDSTVPVTDDSTRELVRERFNSALRIYAQYISTRHAEFPINISSQDLKKLEAVFEDSAKVLYGERREVDPATPFDFPTLKLDSSPPSSQGSEKGITEGTTYGDRVQYWGNVPESFNESVFDEAERSIKYLVLTNTWPKFVKDRRNSTDSGDFVESGYSVAQQARDRLSTKIAA